MRASGSHNRIISINLAVDNLHVYGKRRFITINCTWTLFAELHLDQRVLNRLATYFWKSKLF